MTEPWHIRVIPPDPEDAPWDIAGHSVIDTFSEAVEGASSASVIHASYVSPLMFDSHTHGRMGLGVQPVIQGLSELVSAYSARGMAGVQLSTVTASISDIQATLDEARDVKAQDSRLVGIHLEGPFLSAEKRGAHAEQLLLKGSLETVKKTVGGFVDIVTSMTLDPLSVDDGVIDWLVGQGVIVAVGHTNAGYDQALKAFESGASVLTHAFNAMRPISAREPGPVMAAIDHGAWIEVIADGHHVHSSLVKWLFEAAPEKLLLVSDSMPAAGLADGEYHLGDLAVSVSNGVARTKDGKLAGSTLSLDQAVAHAVRCGVAPDVALAAATTNPARAYAQSVPVLAQGEAANLVVWSDQMQVTHVMRDGEVTAWS